MFLIIETKTMLAQIVENPDWCIKSITIHICNLCWWSKHLPSSIAIEFWQRLCLLYYQINAEVILILNLILFFLFGIFVKTKKLAWQANQNHSIYTLFLIIKMFFRSIEIVFYKTSQNIPTWPNNLFLAPQNSWEEKQTWH